MRFAIDTLGVRQIDRELTSMSGRIDDMSVAMGDIFDYIRKVERKQFDSEGKYGSDGWKQLAPSTIESKKAHNLDPRILRATGDLFEAMTRRGDGKQVAVAKRDGLVFGTTLPYAQFHQQGRGVPKRPVVELKEPDRREIIKIIQHYIREDSV